MTVESSMARLRGALEAGLGVLVVDCPYVDASPEARAWIAGYVVSVVNHVSAKAQETAPAETFDVKRSRDGARWRWVEQAFVEQGWRAGLAPAELAHRLSRSPLSVRVAACQLGLGKRPESRRSKTDAAAEMSADAPAASAKNGA